MFIGAAAAAAAATLEAHYRAFGVVPVDIEAIRARLAAGAQDRGPDWFVFPRSEKKRIARMTQHMAWKVEQQKARFWRKVRLSLIFVFGIPVLLTALAWAWRLCAWSIAG